MSFSGRVTRESHEGGVLISFEGRPPRLGARIRISGGKIIGRVDTVLGPVGSPLIHIRSLYDGIDASASVGSPVEIAPREKPRQGRPRGRHSGGSFRERRGSRKISSGGRGGRGSGGKGGRSFRDNKGGGSGGRGANRSRRGSKAGRRRDSSKGGRGNRRR